MSQNQKSDSVDEMLAMEPGCESLAQLREYVPPKRRVFGIVDEDEDDFAEALLMESLA
jgi:hypothetical protein